MSTTIVVVFNNPLIRAGGMKFNNMLLIQEDRVFWIALRIAIWPLDRLWERLKTMKKYLLVDRFPDIRGLSKMKVFAFIKPVCNIGHWHHLKTNP